MINLLANSTAAAAITAAITAAIEDIESTKTRLERASAGLRTLLAGTDPQPAQFDPMDPANKNPDRTLTPRGAEVCYRLFDLGRSRYQVSKLMAISFGAADHRYKVWQRKGGVNRQRQSL